MKVCEIRRGLHQVRTITMGATPERPLFTCDRLQPPLPDISIACFSLLFVSNHHSQRPSKQQQRQLSQQHGKVGAKPKGNHQTQGRKRPRRDSSCDSFDSDASFDSDTNDGASVRMRERAPKSPSFATVDVGAGASTQGASHALPEKEEPPKPKCARDDPRAYKPVPVPDFPPLPVISLPRGHKKPAAVASKSSTVFASASSSVGCKASVSVSEAGQAHLPAKLGKGKHRSTSVGTNTASVGARAGVCIRALTDQALTETGSTSATQVPRFPSFYNAALAQLQQQQQQHHQASATTSSAKTT